MAKDYFDFQQFRVYHDKCAMKVGTDGVLLGAWGSIGDARRVGHVGVACAVLEVLGAVEADAAGGVGFELEQEAAHDARLEILLVA